MRTGSLWSSRHRESNKTYLYLAVWNQRIPRLNVKYGVKTYKGERINTFTFLIAWSCRAEYSITDCCAAQVLDRMTAPRLTELNAAWRAWSSKRAQGSACRTIHMTKIMFRRSTVKVGPLKNEDRLPLLFFFWVSCSSLYEGPSTTPAAMALWRALHGGRVGLPSRWPRKLK